MKERGQCVCALEDALWCRVLAIEYFLVRGRTDMVVWEGVDGFAFYIENG